MVHHDPWSGSHQATAPVTAPIASVAPSVRSQLLRTSASTTRPSLRASRRSSTRVCRIAQIAVLQARPATLSGVQISVTFSAKFSVTIAMLTFTGVMASPRA